MLRQLLFLQFALSCYAWQAGPNQGPRRTITGTVTNSATGEPIRRALVSLSSERAANVLTNESGRFEFTGVPEGTIFLTATKPGFFDWRAIPGARQNPSNSLVVNSGKTDFPLTLFPAAKIAGRVVDQEGEPIEGTQVQILGEQIWQGRKHWQPQNGSGTDEDGSYHLDGLLPGSYILFAAGQALPPQSWNGQSEVDVSLYYPNAPDLASAQAIEVRPGQEVRADFRLRSERGYRLTGQIVGMPAGSVPSLSFTNATGQQIPAQFKVDRSNNRFEVSGIPSGAWTLVVQAMGREARQEIVVDHADAASVQMILRPAMAIPVTVNHASPPAPSRAENHDSARWRFITPSGQTGTPMAVQATLNATDPTAPNSRPLQWMGDPPALSFIDVPAGSYNLQVQNAGNECVDSTWYGGIDLLRDPLVVDSEGSAQPIIINLRADCATLTAKLRSASPRSGVLFVVPHSSFSDPKVVPVSARTSSPLTLSPGEYQVFAFTNIDGLEYANPETMRGYPGQTINLDRGQKTELILDLIERKETP